jgi:LAS superfamily LD-carboxypeptidase LdcB
VQVAQENGLGPVVTSAYRSYAQQAVLYRRYLAGQSPLPAAPPGHSKHNYGLAVDVDLPQNRAALAALGAWWTSIGGRWGGMSDPVHFEAP